MSTVTIDVVAAEEDIRLVAVDDLGEPPERLASGRVAKVLLVDVGGVTPAENVVACLPAEKHRLLEALGDVGMLGSVAGGVDGVAVHGAGIPCGGCGFSGTGGHSDCCGALTGDERSRKGSGSSE